MIVSRSQGGGSGGASVLFNSVLGADAASIDSGAGGFAQTFSVLLVDIVVRTDDAAAFGAAAVILNNDASAIYDLQNMTGNNATVAAATARGTTSWGLNVHGAGGSASYPSHNHFRFPLYAATTFFKVGTYAESIPDATAANCRTLNAGLGYRSASAITRVKVTVGGAGTVLKAGSAMVISAL